MSFIEKMKDLNQIYNHTTDICFDENKIYLIANWIKQELDQIQLLLFVLQIIISIYRKNIFKI